MSFNRKTLYKSNFQRDIDDIVDYISKDSMQNALQFIKGMKPAIDKIIRHPEANPIVRQIPTKRNWYRYRLYKKRYKIIFKVLSTKVVFLGIVHSAQHPDSIVKMRTKDYS